MENPKWNNCSKVKQKKALLLFQRLLQQVMCLFKINDFCDKKLVDSILPSIEYCLKCINPSTCYAFDWACAIFHWWWMALCDHDIPLAINYYSWQPILMIMSICEWKRCMLIITKLVQSKSDMPSPLHFAFTS